MKNIEFWLLIIAAAVFFAFLFGVAIIKWLAHFGL